MFYVYGIKNITNNKFYIGVTDNIGRRFNEHMSYGIKGYEKISSSPCKNGLYLDMYILGVDKFIFKVLEVINSESRQIAFDKEEYWIRKCNSVENGYNTVYNAFKCVKENNFYNCSKRTFTKNEIEIFNNIINKKESLEIKIDERIIYVVKDTNNNIISMGSRKLTNLKTCINTIKNYFKNGEKDLVAQLKSPPLKYAADNKISDKVEIEIIKSIPYEDESYKDFIRNFAKENLNLFVLKQWAIDKYINL